MDHPNYPETESTGFFTRNRQVFKAGFVGFLILVLMIPTFFISSLIEERKERNDEVKHSIANQWSQAQTITGPVIAIPFNENSYDDLKRPTIKRYYAYFLPDKLEINGSLQPEIKQRSIFKVPVYTASMHLSGSFKPIDLNRLGLHPENMLWQEAKLIVGVVDTKGLIDETTVQWDGQAKSFTPGNDCGVGCIGLPSTNTVSDENLSTDEGLALNLDLNAANQNAAHSFSFDLKLRGSEKIFFIPVGNTTKRCCEQTGKIATFKVITYPKHMHLPIQVLPLHGMYTAACRHNKNIV